MVKYSDKFQAAVDYIESNLDQDISGSRVAEAVGYSKYHFHRIFLASMGESVAEYIRRRRLNRALYFLQNSDKSILEIALDSKFDSQESFTRAFKKMYGDTPGRFRKEKLSTSIITEPSFSLELLEHLKEGITMEPTFKDRKDELAVGVGGSFKEGDFQEISNLWKQFDNRMHEIENVKEGYSFGVCMESHPEIEVEAGDGFVYFAALPVLEVSTIPRGMHVITIPANRYAVFTHSGPIDKIGHTVKYIWGTWIPRNSEIIKKGPDFELYDNRFDVEKLAGEVDIYVPVRS